MKIYIGSDHAGFELKEKLIPFLKELGHEIEDKGAYSLDPQDDYPDFVIPTARAVANDPEHSRGIVLGGSGQGEAICANRTRGVRAVVWYGGNREPLRLSRAHNNANILSLGAGLIGEESFEAVQMWLETPFSMDERHIRRIEKIDQ